MQGRVRRQGVETQPFNETKEGEGEWFQDENKMVNTDIRLREGWEQRDVKRERTQGGRRDSRVLRRRGMNI